MYLLCVVLFSDSIIHDLGEKNKGKTNYSQFLYDLFFNFTSNFSYPGLPRRRNIFFLYDSTPG